MSKIIKAFIWVIIMGLMIFITSYSAMAHIVAVQNQVNMTFNSDGTAFTVYAVGAAPITFSVVANMTYYNTNFINATYQYSSNITSSCDVSGINETLKSINSSINALNNTDIQQYINNQMAQQFKGQQDWITNTFIPTTNSSVQCNADLKIANNALIEKDKTIASKDEVANIKNEEVDILKKDNANKTYIAIAVMSMLILMALLMSGSILWGRFKYS